MNVKKKMKENKKAREQPGAQRQHEAKTLSVKDENLGALHQEARMSGFPGNNVWRRAKPCKAGSQKVIEDGRQNSRANRE